MRSRLPLGLPLLIAVTLAGGCRSSESAARGATKPDSAAPTAASAAAATDSITARADRGRIRGSESATVWVIEASDFQCPFCKVWHDSTYPSIVRDYVNSGKVRMAYLNFPLNIHPNAMPAAEAAMCASAQNRFWEMHDALFDSQQQWAGLQNAVPMYDSLASKIGIDMAAWRDCMTNHRTRTLIELDYERSERQGVQSTPSFFVGDQGIAGAEPYPVFRDAIERALARRVGRTPGR